MTGCEHHKGGEGENNAQLLMPREKMLKFGISALTDVEAAGAISAYRNAR